uniref:Uncharacterized protein n=1 Tax=Amphimedon queenslandica TaxID=400682 RepID=A0A1X7UW16_AMPQE
MAASRCCQCNGKNGRCRRACVKKGLPCPSCLREGDNNACCNRGWASSNWATNPRGPIRPSSSSSGAAHSKDPGSDPGLPDPTSPSLPSLEAIFGLQVPLLHHIPKGACNSWSGIFSDALNTIVAWPSDVEAWSHLLMLPKCVLFLPPYSQRRQGRDLAPH